MKHVHWGIDWARKRALHIEHELSTLKWIVFSDHHRGQGDGADDFLKCEPAYIKALNHYLELGYHLILLGDVEEFWENSFKAISSRYRSVMELESEFFKQGKFIKVWGNHDDSWRFKLFVKSKLGDLFPSLIVHEAISLKIQDKENYLGEIVFIHGHQGTLGSDRFSWLSKIFVRYIWRNIQRLFHIQLSTPSRNLGLKSDHDRTMYEWARRQENTMLVCGHTHQPVFLSRTHLDELNDQVVILKKRLLENPDETSFKEKLGVVELKLRELSEPTTLSDVVQGSHPYYFNSGCCSFSDGDITGLEFTDGEIKLVKWNALKKVEHRQISIRDLFT